MKVSLSSRCLFRILSEKVGNSVHSCREEWTFLARFEQEEWTVLARFGRDMLVEIVLGGMDSFG